MPPEVRRRACTITLLLALLASTVHAAGEDLLLGPLQVVDIETGDVRAGRTLLIRDGVVAAESVWDPAVAETSVRWINAAGGFAIPGLAEMHAHIPPQADGEQRVRDVLLLYLANGITTVRGMLGEPWHLELRELLRTGKWDGPRLVTSGPSFNGQTVTSPEQAGERVRQQAAAGYDFLKIHPGLTAAEYASIAVAAAEAGIPVGGHVPAAVGLEAALGAGQRTIDHLDGYAQELLPADSPLAGVEPEFFGVNLGAALVPGRAAELAAATLAAGVWNVPTQSLLDNALGARSIAELMGRPEMRFVTPERAAQWRRSVEGLRAQYDSEERAGLLRARRALLTALHQAGARLLLGSDAPQIMNVPGFSIHEELALLVAAGLTPLQALQSGSLGVADFLAEPDRGAIAAGQVADLVVLGGNPVEDITATRRVIGVLRAGRWYDRARLDAGLAAIAERGI